MVSEGASGGWLKDSSTPITRFRPIKIRKLHICKELHIDCLHSADLDLPTEPRGKTKKLRLGIDLEGDVDAHAVACTLTR